MVGAAQNVCHSHLDVVHHHAEVIGGDAVGAQQNEILDLAVGELHAAEHGVIEECAAALRHGESDGGGFSGITAGLACSDGTLRHFRSYCGSPPSACACARRCSSSSFVQKQ